MNPQKETSRDKRLRAAQTVAHLLLNNKSLTAAIIERDYREMAITTRAYGDRQVASFYKRVAQAARDIQKQQKEAA